MPVTGSAFRRISAAAAVALTLAACTPVSDPPPASPGAPPLIDSSTSLAATTSTSATTTSSASPAELPIELELWPGGPTAVTVQFTTGEGPHIPDYAGFELRCGGNPDPSQLVRYDEAGGEVWSTQLPYSWRGSVDVTGGAVYTTVEADWFQPALALAYDTAGAPMWQTSFSWDLVPGAIYTEEQMILLLRSEGSSGGAVGLDLEAGQVLWAHETPGRPLRPNGGMLNGALVAIGDSKGAVTSVDVESGELAWQASFGGEIEDPPWVSADRVYVAANARLMALDRFDASLVWEARREPAPEFVGRILGVTDTHILAETEDSTTMDVSEIFTVSAFNLVDGMHAWDVSGSDWTTLEGDVLFIGSPEVDERGGFSSQIVAYDSLTGAQMWRSDNRWQLRNTVSVDGSLLLAGHETTMARVDPATGLTDWRATVGYLTLAPFVVHGHLATAFTNRSIPSVQVLSLIDIGAGNVLWSQEYERAVASTAFAANGDVIALLATDLSVCF